MLKQRLREGRFLVHVDESVFQLRGYSERSYSHVNCPNVLVQRVFGGKDAKNESLCLAVSSLCGKVHSMQASGRFFNDDDLVRFLEELDDTLAVKYTVVMDNCCPFGQSAYCKAEHRRRLYCGLYSHHERASRDNLRCAEKQVSGQAEEPVGR